MFIYSELNVVVGTLRLLSSAAPLLHFFCSIAEGLYVQWLPAPASWTAPGVGCSLSELLWLPEGEALPHLLLCWSGDEPHSC